MTDPAELTTMTYEVTGRVARITFNRPDKGNAIIAATLLELAACVERADIDPNVHVILVSGRGEGFARVSTCPPMPTARRPRGGIVRERCSMRASWRKTTCRTSRGIRWSTTR